VTLKTFLALVDRNIEELNEHNIAASHSELMTRYLLQIEQCEDSELFCTALDKWNTMRAVAMT